jgi:hypothetical protein
MPNRAALLLSVAAVALLVLVLPISFAHGTAPAGSAPVASAGTMVATHPPNPFVDGMAASIAIGQPNLTGNWYNSIPNASNIGPDPENPCMDAQGNLFVPNFSGHRITEYLAPLSTNESASVVIGQQNFSGDAPGLNQSTFYSPASCAFDSHGDLWVPDFYNGRVLEFKPPFHTGMNASLVIGQYNFNTSGYGTNQSALSGPTAVTFDPSGDLWLAESYNNRIIEFKPPFHDGMNASLVLGQSNFNTSESGTSSTNLSFPDALTYGDGVLWVSDLYNDRVIGFPAPFSDGEGAAYVLGQSNFSVWDSVGPTAMLDPYGVSVDHRGDLWVSDMGNNRILEYLPPFSSNESPSLVIGQSSLATNAIGVGPAGLDNPLGVWVGPTGTLWVADGANDRVLGYVPQTYSVGFSASGLPSGTPWAVSFNAATQAGSAGGVSLLEENGSYWWNVTPIAGYVVSPASGVLSVNGTSVRVALTFTQVTYSVEFEPSGLPSAAAWTVTVAGVAHTSGTGGPISVTEPNGSFSYSVTTVTGYNDTPQSGTITVAGQAQEVGIGFFATPAATSAPPSTSGGSSGSSSGGISLELALLLALVGLIVGAVVGVLVGRRRRGGSSPPPPPQAPTSLPPPAPVAATTSAPVAPWSESEPTPPPGAT